MFKLKWLYVDLSGYGNSICTCLGFYFFFVKLGFLGKCANHKEIRRRTMLQKQVQARNAWPSKRVGWQHTRSGQAVAFAENTHSIEPLKL